MALKIPLVLTSGQIQQLQAGDSLNASCNEVDVVSMTNANAGAVVICAPVYVAAAGTFDKAQANAAATTEILGLVATSPSIAIAGSGNIQTDGILTATTAQWDAVAGTTGGLVAGTVYYVSAATAGLLTATAPSAAGQFVIRVGIALSTLDLDITVTPPIKL